MVDNEIRRLKIKLKLFNEEGFNWIIGDFMEDVFDTNAWEIKYAINTMKQKYLKKLKELEPRDTKQQKLF